MILRIAQVSKFGSWLILLNNMWCNCELDDICIIDVIVYIV